MNILHVVFRVAAAEYVMPASEVVQMESYAGATPVPGGPKHLAGIVQIRGRVVPVIDLRVRFGLPPQEATLDTRILVGQLGNRPVGLLVDSAREVMNLLPEQIVPPPSLVAEQASGFVKAVAQVGNRIVMLIDFERVIGEDQIHVE